MEELITKLEEIFEEMRELLTNKQTSELRKQRRLLGEQAIELINNHITISRKNIRKADTKFKELATAANKILKNNIIPNAMAVSKLYGLSTDVAYKRFKINILTIKNIHKQMILNLQELNTETRIELSNRKRPSQLTKKRTTRRKKS
jgi:hypothetical protein